MLSTIPSSYAGPLNIQGVDNEPDKKIAHQQRFETFLENCRNKSVRFKSLHDRINASPKIITAKVGRSLPHVIVDAFKSDEIDLDDLETFPDPTKVQDEDGQSRWHFPKEFQPWAETVCQTIAHVLSERLYSLENNAGYKESHAEAIKEENKIRPDFGQTSTVVSRYIKDEANQDGTFDSVETYSDGKTETYKLDFNTANFVGIPIFSK